MKSLHTIEEIKALDNDMECAIELKKLAAKYSKPELNDIANSVISHYNLELGKYNQFVGLVCKAPPSFLSNDKSYREGKIEKFTHFNYFSKSVRCNIRYKSDGFDGHAFTELIIE
jgi:hypothetical protein